MRYHGIYAWRQRCLDEKAFAGEWLQSSGTQHFRLIKQIKDGFAAKMAT